MTTDQSADAERAHAIVAALREGLSSSEEVFAAFAELDTLSPDVVRTALGAWTGPAPDLDRLDDDVRRAHRLPERQMHLEVLATASDADVLDVGSVAEEQLRVAGRSWDGADLAAEERLDGEIEGSFAGGLERIVLGDVEAPGRPVFDVFLYAGDSGTVFRAGATDIVGMIAYHVLEMADRRARLAIQEALTTKQIIVNQRPLKLSTGQRPDLNEAAPDEVGIARSASDRRAAAQGLGRSPMSVDERGEAGRANAVRESEEHLNESPRVPERSSRPAKRAPTTPKVAATAKATAKRTTPAKKAAATPKRAAATPKKVAAKQAAATKKSTSRKATEDKPAAKKATATKKATTTKTAASKASTKKASGSTKKKAAADVE